MDNDDKERAAYEAPTLTVYGSFEELTLGYTGATKLDKVFPTGTPRGDLTTVWS